MVVDKYASVRRYFATTKPIGVPEDDQNRLLAYETYENFYWNVPESYKLIARDSEVAPIHLPSARSMIEATHRFLAVDWDFLVDPAVGTPADREVITQYFRKLFKRERLYTKFASQKRWGLTRGDALWHITANPNKPQGQRISIHELHPGRYFPIFDKEDPDRLVGCHIVDEIENPNDDTKMCSRRQTYRKLDPNSDTVTSSLILFELGKWDDRDKPEDVVQIKVIAPAAPLPPQITQLPVYHIKNYAGAELWGSSQLRGIETVFGAVSQAVSDQDLALALQGLGVYWTDSGPPKLASGEDGPFVMGPGEVVEVAPGTSFGRVSGIAGSLPGIEHMNYLLDSAFEATGVAEVARGRADVQIAESGVSLAIQMGPLLAQNGEKESELLAVQDQLFFDLIQMWLPAYESLNVPDVDVTNIVGDPMPKNREAEIAEVVQLIEAKLITREMAQVKLTELGYEFPEGALQQLEDEAAAALVDPFAQRMDNEEIPSEEEPPAFGG